MFEKGITYYRCLGRGSLIELEFLGNTDREGFIFKNIQKGDSYIFDTNKSDGIFKTKKEAIDYTIAEQKNKIDEINRIIDEISKL